MASLSRALTLDRLSCVSHSSIPFLSVSPSSTVSSLLVASPLSTTTGLNISPSQLWVKKNRPRKHICRAAEYKFPDPIPEFADAETDKFRTHLLKKLTKKEVCGNSLDDVIGICTEIFSTFLHTEYGGPGTLLVLPFIDMADTINERGLPGGPQAARAAVKWAQDNVDKDWKEWNGGEGN